MAFGRSGETFGRGRTFSAWKIGLGKDDGKTKFKKSKDLEVTLLNFNLSTLSTYTMLTIHQMRQRVDSLEKNPSDPVA